jgi:tetratricopeptide (TPR) repeat protein
VRGVTWAGLGNQAQQSIYKTLSTHFESLPMIDEEEIESLEDLTSAIELYNTLIGLGRYDDAEDLYYERLSDALLYRLGAMRLRAELLEMLFPDGLDQLPRLSAPSEQSDILNSMAITFCDSGRIEQGIGLFRLSLDIKIRMSDRSTVGIVLYNLSDVLLSSGALHDSEVAIRQALLIGRESSDQITEDYLRYLGRILATRGEQVESAKAFNRSLELALQSSIYTTYDFMARCAIWLREYTEAWLLAQKALTHSQRKKYERGMIRATLLQGEATLGLNDLETAEERLQHALARARVANFVDEELLAMIGLAELRQRQGDLKASRELLDDVWEPAERGPFKLFHADAYNVLAQIERDAGDHAAAAKAATEAYRLAWCDGPPFAYHWGLQKAKAHLSALGVPEPSLSPFDASRYEPMPEVEIDPPGKRKSKKP